MYKVNHINKQDLPKIEHLLRKSFGPTFDLKDEIDYFDSMPTSSWFYLLDEKNGPQAFIRCFPSEENVLPGEFYAEPSEERDVFIRALLLHFKKHCELAAGQQVRFDAEIGDQMTIKTLGEVFPESAITTYLHYFKSIRDVTAIEQPSFITKDENSLNRIRNILLCLKDYSLSNLIELMKANELVVYEIDDIPVSVLHYKEENFNTCEIITLATADDSRGKGCGTALLNKFFGFAASQFNSIILKVKENNLTAVRLYEKTGFQKVENKTEQWWYVVPKP